MALKIIWIWVIQVKDRLYIEQGNHGLILDVIPGIFNEYFHVPSVHPFFLNDSG